MANQLTSNAEALRLFFTEEVYLVKRGPDNSATVQVGALPEIVELTNVAEPISIPATPSFTPIEPKKEWTFNYLGKNQKGILILVNDPVNKVSSTEGTELLRKLVKAIELTNNDFALINYANYEGATFEVLQAFFKCQLLLSFGVEAEKLGIAPLPYHLLHNLGTTRLILTSNLHELDKDQPSKKTLWATLQTLK
jgi:hypothetical protein